MTGQEALSRMIPPGAKRKGKYREGVIQVWVTRGCDKACFHCTQGSNLSGKPHMITLEQFEQACKSLEGWWGVVGIFGGNPATHPQFDKICEILRNCFPKEQRGLWCNNPLGKGKIMRETFDPAVSNLNVHMDSKAYNEFRWDWPESRPFGLGQDSRHAPVHLAMMDVLQTTCGECSGRGGFYDRSNGERYLSDPEDGTEYQKCNECGGTGKVYDESKAWELISGCDINKHWSAMLCVFRNQLKAYFCEVAGAQAMLHQDDPSWPDLGLDPDRRYIKYEHDIRSPMYGLPKSEETYLWWELPMERFAEQVKYHCHRCGVPLRGYGELAQSNTGVEQTSPTHADIYSPKRLGRSVEVVTTLEQLGTSRVGRVIDYMQNAKR